MLFIFGAIVGEAERQQRLQGERVPDDLSSLEERMLERLGAPERADWQSMVSVTGPCDGCRRYVRSTLEDRRMVEIMLTEVSLEPLGCPPIFCERCVYHRVRAAARATLKALDAAHKGGRFIHNKMNGTVRCVLCGEKLRLSRLTSEWPSTLKEVVEFVSTHRRRHGEDQRGRVSIVSGAGGELSVAHAGEGALSETT